MEPFKDHPSTYAWFDKAHNQLAIVKHAGELLALIATLPELYNELIHVNNCHVMMLCG